MIQAALVLSSLPSPLTMSFVGAEIVASTAVLGLVRARVIRAIGILGVNSLAQKRGAEWFDDP